MNQYSIQDPDYETRVRESFNNQSIMTLFGAELSKITPGRCEITLPFRTDLCQQDGFFHAGVTSTIADSAGGYAAFSLMPADARVLTVEYKMNLLAPADGEKLSACGEVMKNGRKLIVTRVDVTISKEGDSKLCATLLQTLICLRPRKQVGNKQ